MELIRSSSRRIWTAFAAALVVGACASETEQPTPTSPDQSNAVDVLELKLTPGFMTFIQPTADGPIPAPKRIIAFNQAALIPQTGIQLSPMMYDNGIGGWFNVSFVITGLSANIDGRIVPNNLPVGVYTGKFTVRVPGTRNSPVTVNVTYVKGIYFQDNAESATGWSSSGLWNLSTLVGICNVSDSPGACLPPPDEGQRAWWYGQPSTGDFETGGTNSGEIVSPEFTIPNGAVMPMLGFRTTWESEGCCSYDRKVVYFRESGTNDMTYLGIMGGNGDQMENEPVYLSAFLDMSSVIGKTGRLVFDFDTGDSIANDFRGWVVDRIVVAEEAAFAGLGFPDSPNPGCNDYDYDYGDCFDDYDYDYDVLLAPEAEGAGAARATSRWFEPGAPRSRP